jgi:hypothetical protein
MVVFPFVLVIITPQTTQNTADTREIITPFQSIIPCWKVLSHSIRKILFTQTSRINVDKNVIATPSLRKMESIFFTISLFLCWKTRNKINIFKNKRIIPVIQRIFEKPDFIKFISESKISIHGKKREMIHNSAPKATVFWELSRWNPSNLIKLSIFNIHLLNLLFFALIL